MGTESEEGDHEGEHDGEDEEQQGERKTMKVLDPVDPRSRRSPSTSSPTSRFVSGRQSSRVTKVPWAELHRVLRFMESLEFVMKRNRKRRKVK